jgi:hypothetical protein
MPRQQRYKYIIHLRSFMESSQELMDIILSDNSSEEISDKIKEILFTKSSENIDSVTPYIAQSLFGTQVEEE